MFTTTYPPASTLGTVTRGRTLGGIRHSATSSNILARDNILMDTSLYTTKNGVTSSINTVLGLTDTTSQTAKNRAMSTNITAHDEILADTS